MKYGPQNIAHVWSTSTLLLDTAAHAALLKMHRTSSVGYDWKKV